MNDQVLWSMFFASVTAMMLHPGNFAKGDEEAVIQRCAGLADLMMDELRRRT